MTESNSQPSYLITGLQENDRPKDRLYAFGPKVLSNAELISILRVGVPGENAVQVGQQLLYKFKAGCTGHHVMNYVINTVSEQPKQPRLKPQLNWAGD